MTDRSLVETNVIAGKPGNYQVIGSLREAHIPPTVQAILAARIDRLSAGAKQLLQAASVLGTQVPHAIAGTDARHPGNAAANQLCTEARLRDVRLELRPVLNQLGKPRRMLERLHEAEILAERLNDDRQRGRVCALWPQRTRCSENWTKLLRQAIVRGRVFWKRCAGLGLRSRLARNGLGTTRQILGGGPVRSGGNSSR